MTSSPSPSGLPATPAGPAPLHGQRGVATRRVLLAAGALVATAGGFWFGLRRAGHGGAGESGGTHADVSSSTKPAAAPASDASSPAEPPLIHGDQLAPAFWQQVFDTPAGPPLTLARFQGRPLVLNFWATWCPPCVKEMPELDQFSRDFSPQGGHVLGLAIDSPTPVKQFLTKVRVGFAIGLAGFGGTELAQALGNTSGGLPFTVVIDAQGRIRQRKMGATSHAELSAWARALKTT